jgi:hypothetical protein
MIRADTRANLDLDAGIVLIYSSLTRFVPIRLQNLTRPPTPRTVTAHER